MFCHVQTLMITMKHGHDVTALFFLKEITAVSRLSSSRIARLMTDFTPCSVRPAYMYLKVTSISLMYTGIIPFSQQAPGVRQLRSPLASPSLLVSWLVRDDFALPSLSRIFLARIPTNNTKVRSWHY